MTKSKQLSCTQSVCALPSMNRLHHHHHCHLTVTVRVCPSVLDNARCNTWGIARTRRVIFSVCILLFHVFHSVSHAYSKPAFIPKAFVAWVETSWRQQSMHGENPGSRPRWSMHTSWTTPQSDNRALLSLDNSGLSWTVSAPDKVTAVPVVRRNGNFQTPISVPAVRPKTMSHIVESCPQTRLHGGLSKLHSADDDAVAWLTSYGS